MKKILIATIIVLPLFLVSLQQLSTVLEINDKFVKSKANQELEEIKGLPLHVLLAKDMIPSSWEKVPSQVYYLLEKISIEDYQLLIYSVGKIKTANNVVGVGGTYKNNLIFNLPTVYSSAVESPCTAEIEKIGETYYLIRKGIGLPTIKIDLLEHLNHQKYRFTEEN